MNRKKTFLWLKEKAAIAAIVLLCLCGAGTASLAQSPECEAGDPTCSCAAKNNTATRKVIDDQNKLTKEHITDDFTTYEIWLVYNFFHDNVIPAMEAMAGQLTTVGMQQMNVLGALLDAKQQLEVQGTFQKLAAEAHKTYQSSVDMCAIGTVVRGLAAGDANARANAVIMAQRSQDRQLGSVNTSSTEGYGNDIQDRVEQFKNRFCDPHDNMDGFRKICPGGNPSTTVNKDISYTRTIDVPKTLDVDFSASGLTGDGEDVLALESNLYGHTVFDRMSKANVEAAQNQQAYLEQRSIVAKRSVVENSFLAIAGMKSQGSGASTSALFVQAFLKNMGIPPLEANIIMGSRPSYYAQLEVLTQKIYQDPEFFSNLYDTPVNVARKDVAMQAIDLMLDRNMYKSELRYEADLAVMLGIELSGYQENIDDRLHGVTTGGRVN